MEYITKVSLREPDKKGFIYYYNTNFYLQIEDAYYKIGKFFKNRDEMYTSLEILYRRGRIIQDSFIKKNYLYITANTGSFSLKLKTTVYKMTKSEMVEIVL